MGETWKPAPRYEGFYEVSDMGNVRHLRPGKEPRLLKPIIGNKKRYSARVSLFANGIRENFVITRLVWEAFRGPAPEGYVITHKNGQIYNNELRNLELKTISEHFQGIGGESKRKTVLKLNKNGEIVKIYRSCTAAGRAEGYSHTTISNRCTGKCKESWDFDFCYEDSVKSKNAALRRLGLKE